jgi:carboxyl-terminal processing protease
MPPPIDLFTVQECSSAQARPWSTLCRAHDLVTAHHIDVPEAASLAAAATAGVRVAESAGLASDTATETVACVVPDEVYLPLCEAIADRHHIDRIPLDVLGEGAVQGLFRFGLDPFSSYLTADYAERIDALGSGHVFSIGLIVGARDGTGAACGPISSSCVLSVMAVFDFTPAAREGVLAGDVIVQIDGVSTTGLSETEAVAALHAGPGEITLLDLTRPTGRVSKELVHEDIRQSAVEFVMASPQIAYIRVNEFSQEAAQAVGQVLRQAEVESAFGLVLDLRDNPGGLVLSAQAVASQFLREGVVLTEETRRGSFDLAVIEGGLASDALEVVVVVNAGTASAAEIVAAALQAQGRALVVGEPTFGKDLVQEVFAAPGGGEFRISVARWTGPGGVDVGGAGLQPDVLGDAGPGDDSILDVAFRLLGG